MATMIESITLLVGLAAILYGVITLYFWPLIRNGGMPQPKVVRLKSYGRIFEFLAYALNPKRWDNRLHRAFGWGFNKEYYCWEIPYPGHYQVHTELLRPGEVIEVMITTERRLDGNFILVDTTLDC